MSSAPLTYQVGAASERITPDEPLWLAGYAVRTAPARERISELYASAVALKDYAGQRLVIASIDNLSMTPQIAGAVADRIYKKHALSRYELLLAATHTHYAPEHRTDFQMFYHIPKEYVAKMPAVADRLIDGLNSAIDRSLGNMEPVRLFARRASATFAHNRRRHGVVAGTPSPEDIRDEDVPILDCVTASGKHKAIIFTYACHQTTIPAEDLRYCGDWAGFARDQLQQQYPECVPVFIPGAGADQDPEPRGSLELSRQYGQELAAAIMQTIDVAGGEIRGPMGLAWDEVIIPLEPVTNEKIERMIMADDPPQRVKAESLRAALPRAEQFASSYTAPLQVVRFGDELLCIALSGEPVIDWAHTFKAEFQHAMNAALSVESTPVFPLVWVAGYCNDVFDYVPTRRIQIEGGYEGGRANLWNSIAAPITQEAEGLITNSVRRLVQRASAYGIATA